MTDIQNLDEAGILTLAEFIDDTTDDTGFLDGFRQLGRDTAATLRACLRGEVEPAEAELTAQAWVGVAKLEIERRNRIGELSELLRKTAAPVEWRAMLIESVQLMSDGHIAGIMGKYRMELALGDLPEMPDVGALFH